MEVSKARQAPLNLLREAEALKLNQQLMEAAVLAMTHQLPKDENTET